MPLLRFLTRYHRRPDCLNLLVFVQASFFFSSQAASLFLRVSFSLLTRELKQRRFWATHVNRKWPFFIFWRWFRANFQSNRLYNSKEAKEYKFYIRGMFIRGKIPHFRLTCVAPKRRCLSSLLSLVETAHSLHLFFSKRSVWVNLFYRSNLNQGWYRESNSRKISWNLPSNFPDLEKVLKIGI